MGSGDTGMHAFRSEQRSSEVQFRRSSVCLAGNEWEVAAGYRRCRSFDAGNDDGQDFAAVRFDSRYIVGVITDGVAQSFHGAIAAREVADALLVELWKHREGPPGDTKIAEALQQRATTVGRTVEAFEISASLPEMVRLADEETRRHGTQAVFSAFVLDAASGRLHIYKVGDAPALVFAPGAPPELIDSPRRGRWSSTGNTDLQLRVEVRDGVDGCLVHSDGLESTWGFDGQLPARDDFDPLAEERSEHDDVSFVWVRRLSRRPLAAVPLPHRVMQPPALVPKSTLPPVLREPVEPVNEVGEASVVQPSPVVRRSMPPVYLERAIDPPSVPQPRRRQTALWLRYAAVLAAGILIGWATSQPPLPIKSHKSRPIPPTPVPTPTPPPKPILAATPSPPSSNPEPSAVSANLKEKEGKQKSGCALISVTLGNGVGKVELRYAETPFATLIRNHKADVDLRLLGIPKGQTLPLLVLVYNLEGSLVRQETFAILDQQSYKLKISDDSH